MTEMASTADRARNADYDKLRAIGIVLVVLGHTLGISRGAELYIYSFHMPLFFFISGLVLTPTRLSQTSPDAVWHYGRRLLLPYLLFSMLTYLPWVLVTRNHGADAALGVEAWRPLIGTLYGIGVDGWLQHNAMLWFFPCLFVAHLVFRVVHELVKGWTQYVMIAVLAGIGYLLSLVLTARLPWGVEIALIALPFYALGQVFASHNAWLPRAGLSTALLLLLFAALQFACIALNGRVDMNFISLGNPVLFYLGAVSGIGALGCLVAFLPPLSLFARLADAAVLAFPLHRTLFSVFSAFGLWLVHDLQAFKLSVWGSVSYTVGALLLSVLLLPWIRRWCPILIGGR
ncbi:MAG TPA: acyltransferase family protein [Rhodocyclaceae bacterium]|jgi:acyltransferase